MAEFVQLLCPSAAPASGGNGTDVVAKFRGLCKTVEEVRAAFNSFDAAGNGEISFAELKNGASSLGKFSAGELVAVSAIGDINIDGEISLMSSLLFFVLEPPLWVLDLANPSRT